MSVRWLPALSLSLALSPGLPAQVPDGWVVSANFQWSVYDPFWNPIPPPGDGGLFLHHPTAGGAAIPVTGLPSAITGSGVPGPAGASTVVFRPSDGALIVGDNGPAGTTISLHVITLTGSAATGVTTIPLGTSASFPLAQVGQAALLPNGDVVVAVEGLGPPGPLAGEVLGIVSTASGTVTPVPVTPVPPGFMNALAVDASDPSAPIAYFGMFQSPSPAQSTIYGVALPAGGMPATVVTLGPTPTVGLTNLALDGSGGLWVTAFNGPPNLFHVDPATGTVLSYPGLGFLNAVAFEKATGRLLLSSYVPSTYPFSLLQRDPGGTVSLLTSPPAGGWGAPSGLDLNPNPEAYGSGTAGTTTAWALSPNPGGLPTLGNCSFSLTLSAPPGPPAANFFAASLAPANIPNFLGLGFTLLIDPAQVVVPLTLLDPSGTIPLCIPNDPSLVPAGPNLFTTQGQVFFQAFHVVAGGPSGVTVTASEGVEVTVL
jgi:hypothetical protein